MLLWTHKWTHICCVSAFSYFGYKVKLLDHMVVLGRKWQHTQVFLPGESQGQRSLEGYTMGLQRVGHD